MLENKNLEDKNSENQNLENKNWEKELIKNKELGAANLKRMNFGLWLSENRQLLNRIIVTTLIIISAILYTYSTYAYIIYFLHGPVDLELNVQLKAPRGSVSELKLGQLNFFTNQDKYDLAVKVENTNHNFWAQFDYCFYQEENEIYCGQDFILPNEQKYILALSSEILNTQSLFFRIEDIFWQRINIREIPSWEEFYNNRLNFSFQDINFFPAAQSGLSGKLSINSLEFIAQNHSAFGYYNLNFEILFYSGDNLVGLQTYLVNEFRTEEEKLIKISWPGEMAKVNHVQINPIVNIMDDASYLLYQ